MEDIPVGTLVYLKPHVQEFRKHNSLGIIVPKDTYVGYNIEHVRVWWQSLPDSYDESLEHISNLLVVE